MQPSQSFTAPQEFEFTSFNKKSSSGSQRQHAFLENSVSLETAKLAHDAGNLLSALGLYAELLASPGVIAEEYRSYAEELQILADRSNALIERLAGYRRVPAQVPEKVVLPRLIETYTGLLTKVVRRPIELSIGPFADQAIAVSTEAVERVLLNLTKNAATATHPSGTIRITVEGRRTSETNSRGHVLLSVTDDGAGMTRERLQTVFKSAPSINRSGRGFGLHIVRELVEKSGGHLDIQSHPGHGTRVSVRWFTRQIDAA